MFAITKGDQCYHLWTEPDPYHWANNGQWAWVGTFSFATNAAVAGLPDGNLQVFAYDSNNQIHNLSTDQPYHWTDWKDLAEKINIKKIKIGLALGGGASKGDFQVGALKYLYEVKGISRYLDVICGTSVGSINGIKLAEGGESSLFQARRNLGQS